VTVLLKAYQENMWSDMLEMWQLSPEMWQLSRGSWQGTNTDMLHFKAQKLQGADLQRIV
jgi:hypothetical protein